MTRIPPSPWREPVRDLQVRTVGREALLRRLHGDARRRQRTPVYLFGPAGIGKSHVLALLRDDYALAIVPADLPATTSPEALLDRCGDGKILVVEDLERRLRDLGGGTAGRAARQVVRRAFMARERTWIVGTGERLDPVFTDQDEPFFGFFDPIAVEPLSSAEAAQLVDRAARSIRARKGFVADRDAITGLAEGSPRRLLVLAQAWLQHERVDRAIEAVVDDRDDYFRAVFRDLPAFGQDVATRIAHTDDELSPTAIAKALGTNPASVATQMRRLADTSVLLARPGPRTTTYRLADPLFRLWLASRASVR